MNKERIKKLIEALSENIYEKDEVIALSFLATIAGESIFLLGKPGVAKSLIARRLKLAFEGGQSFEYLMNRFSTPDEIFGPVSIQKLKEEDKYERQTEHYLPNATIAFLDEIWKAGPSIQNSLLTIINEKKYRNGAQEIDAKLRGLIAASNELPEKGQGLEALWDRFLIRYLVTRITEEDSFNEMISGHVDINQDIDVEFKIKDKEYEEWCEAINQITIPPEVLKVIRMIRVKLNEYNDTQSEDGTPIYISDRRWKKIIRILRTSAFLNDRSEVDLMDCFLIAHCIWDEQEQIESTREIVAKTLQEHGYALEININAVKMEIETFHEKEILFACQNISFETANSLYKEKAYYKIQEDEGEDVFYVKKDDYDKLSTSESEIKVFNQNGKPCNMTFKIDDQNNPVIHIDNSWHHLSKDRSLYKEIIENQPPTPMLKRTWNEHIKKIKVNIQAQIRKIENYRSEKLAQLGTNLFVNSELSSLVESNLHNTIQRLQKMEIEVEKIKDYYGNI